MFNFGYSQEKTSLSGFASSEKKGVSDARIFLIGTKYATQTDSLETTASKILLKEIIEFRLRQAVFKL